MSRREDACLNELWERLSWMGQPPNIETSGVRDLDTFIARARSAERALREYADELGALADEATNAIGALEES